MPYRLSIFTAFPLALLLTPLSALAVSITAPPGTVLEMSPCIGNGNGTKPVQAPCNQQNSSTANNAANNPNTNPNFPNHGNTVFGAPFYASPAICLAGYVSVCGQNVAVPGGPIGSIAQLVLPSPYQHLPLNVQCVIANNQTGYSIMDPQTIDCKPLTCGPSTISACGAQIPVSESATVGGTIDVLVPQILLGLNAPPKVHFAAQCVDDGVKASYQIANPSELSCTLFPCAESNVKLCDSAITITGGAALGAVIPMTMPPPFKPDPFTVQCVGSNGAAPTYQVTQHDAVTCGLLPDPQ